MTLRIACVIVVAFVVAAAGHPSLHASSSIQAQPAAAGRPTTPPVNVILPNKAHLTAIAAGAPPSQQYVEVIAKFIDMYDR